MTRRPTVSRSAPPWRWWAWPAPPTTTTGRADTAGPSLAVIEEANLVNAMRAIHTDSGGTYGSPRMTTELDRRGWKVNHKRVERLMADNGIVGVHKPPKVRTTLPAGGVPPLPDLVARDFRRAGLTPPGSATSPTNAPTKAGCIWPRCSTWDLAACSATP
jgi:transposase InsO family protein